MSRGYLLPGLDQRLEKRAKKHVHQQICSQPCSSAKILGAHYRQRIFSRKHAPVPGLRNCRHLLSRPPPTIRDCICLGSQSTSLLLRDDHPRHTPSPSRRPVHPLDERDNVRLRLCRTSTQRAFDDSIDSRPSSSRVTSPLIGLMNNHPSVITPSANFLARCRAQPNIAAVVASLVPESSTRRNHGPSFRPQHVEQRRPRRCQGAPDASAAASTASTFP